MAPKDRLRTWGSRLQTNQRGPEASKALSGGAPPADPTGILPKDQSQQTLGNQVVPSGPQISDMSGSSSAPIVSSNNLNATTPQPATTSNKAKDLWDEAYESLLQEQPEIVKTYEEFLLQQGRKNQARGALRNVRSTTGETREEQLGQVLVRQHELYLEEQWKITVRFPNV